jgi:hypothetical protein
MNLQKRNERKASVNDITKGDAMARYGNLLEAEYGATDVPDKGEYVLLHKRIKRKDGNQVDIARART